MNRFQSWSREVEGFTKRAKVRSFFDIKTWNRSARYRNQRIERGWSDQDMWAGGEYIMQMISDSLKWFEQQGVADWGLTFQQWKEDGTDYGYKNLRQIYADIDNYLEHDRSSWAQGLTTQASVENEAYIDEASDKKTAGGMTISWVDKETGKVLTEKQLSKRIEKHHKKAKKLHEKATNALMCWSRHATEFWD